MIRLEIIELKKSHTVQEKRLKIKQICIDMLKKFKDVCDEYELTWYIDGGTLLGAARDGKIIPWDDDVDVVMPREDYTRLLFLAKNIPNFFGSDYFFQTANTDKYFEVHAKLRYNNSTALTPREYTGLHNRGMFLDIFPLDCIPKSKDIQQDIAGFVKTIGKHVGQKNLAQIPSYYFGVLNTVLTDIHQQNLLSGYIANTAFWRYDNNLVVLKKKWYENPTTLKFENIDVPVPCNTDEVLTSWYGKDWYIPKQVENCHHAYVDPFVNYIKYNKITKEEFEYLIK